MFFKTQKEHLSLRKDKHFMAEERQAFYDCESKGECEAKLLRQAPAPMKYHARC